jgi:hypothetical protein
LIRNYEKGNGAGVVLLAVTVLTAATLRKAG